MNLFHKPTMHGSHLLLGGLVLSVSAGFLFNAASLDSPRFGQQEIVSSARLLDLPGTSQVAMERARIERCTPGFSCGQSSRSRLKVDGASALRFSLMLGMSVSR
jgi:hypothetical protein